MLIINQIKIIKIKGVVCHMCKMLEGMKAICYKCGEVKMTKMYHLQGRGYGSIFDGINAYIPVCEDCDTTELEKWIYETPLIVDYVETY